MNFEVIPNEQTPRVPDVEDNKLFISENFDKLTAFWEYAKTRNDAVGLAANQCSIDGERFMVRAFALRDIKTKEWSIIINPVIDEYVGMCEIKAEGCLTWKGQTIIAERHRGIRVKYYGLKGESHYDLRKGFDAQIWQHEINHLDGIEEKVLSGYIELHDDKIGRNDPCPCGAVDIELDVFKLHEIYENGETLEEVGKLIRKSDKTIGRLFKKHKLHIRTKSENQIGENNLSFNNESLYNKDGYVEIWDGEKRILEHRYVMENHIKRKLLSSEIIHHINGIKDDNRIENLKIVTSSTHRKEHSLPNTQWAKNYECCVKCGTTDKKHAGNGYCTKCYMYVRTVEKRGYETEYDENGNRQFSLEHKENLIKSAILREKKRKYKKCCLLLKD